MMEKSLNSTKHIIYLAIFIFLSINNAHSAHKVYRVGRSICETKYMYIDDFHPHKGNVKSVKEYSYTVSPLGRIKRDKNRHNYAHYDQNGNIIEYVEKNKSQQKDDKYICEYDSAGNRTKMYCYSHDSLRCILSSIYDDRGNEIEYKINNHKGFCLQKTTQKIDENGNLIEIRTFKNDTLQSFSKASYDSNGNKLTDSTFNQNGVLIKSIELFYNSVGEVKKMITYNPMENKKDSCFYSYEYDSLGDKTTLESKIINGKQTLSKGYRKNPNGKTLEIWSYKNDKIKYKYIFKYDSEGKLTEKIVYPSCYGYPDPNTMDQRDLGARYRCLNEFDSQGNLVAFYQFYSIGPDYVSKIVCKNDEKGNPLRSKVYNKNDKRRRSPRPDKDTYENYEKRYKYEYYKKSEIKK